MTVPLRTHTVAVAVNDRYGAFFTGQNPRIFEYPYYDILLHWDWSYEGAYGAQTIDDRRDTRHEIRESEQGIIYLDSIILTNSVGGSGGV